MINQDILAKLRPCTGRYRNYLKYYSDFEGSYEEFLKLENISYDDKVWVAVRLFDLKVLQQWSVDCAEFVADNFNREFPDDNRVNECIDVVKMVIAGELDKSAKWSAESTAELAARSAWSAARSAARSTARSTAELAARSAWSAAGSAARSAAELAAESAAESAARSTWSAAESAELEIEQEDMNISLLIALVSEDV